MFTAVLFRKVLDKRKESITSSILIVYRMGFQKQLPELQCQCIPCVDGLYIVFSNISRPPKDLQS